MSAAIHARVLERRAAVARAQAEANDRERFLAAAKGDKGEKGDAGPMPSHEWKGTRLRFEKPDGTWGEFVELRGKAGKNGKDGGVAVIGGGSASAGSGGTAFNPASLPVLPSGVLSTDFLILERGGVAYRVSIEALQAILGGGGIPANAARVNGDPVTVNGQVVTVTASEMPANAVAINGEPMTINGEQLLISG